MKNAKAEKVTEEIKQPRSFKGRPIKYDFEKIEVGKYLFIEGKHSTQMWSCIRNFVKKWHKDWKFGCVNHQVDPAGSGKTGVMVWRKK